MRIFPDPKTLDDRCDCWLTCDVRSELEPNWDAQSCAHDGALRLAMKFNPMTAARTNCFRIVNGMLVCEAMTKPPAPTQDWSRIADSLFSLSGELKNSKSADNATTKRPETKQMENEK
jgi:hypothetical protein